MSIWGEALNASQSIRDFLASKEYEERKVEIFKIVPLIGRKENW